VPRISSIEDVVERQLCTGCGACAWAEPQRFAMRDIPTFGRRPGYVDNPADSTGKALECCPGVGLTHDYYSLSPPVLKDLESCWGPVLAVHEGHAADPIMREKASSGGLASALATFALERMGAAGVLHVGQDPAHPLMNAPTFSESRSDVIASCGSRYSPASPCEALSRIEESMAPSVFIGKPCDVAAVRMAAAHSEGLARNTAFTIGFFCAGVPSTRGLLDLLKQQGVKDPSQVTSMKFRGEGWTGNWVAKWHDAAGAERRAELSYADSWGFLQAYRQWRCHICPDHSGEFADIAVGDPWYRPVTQGEPGSSLIVVRTQRGCDILDAAVSAGYVTLTQQNVSHILPQSQKNLLKARGALWGRLTALRLAGVPVPNYEGFKTFEHWLKELSLFEKIQSVSGTLRRIYRRGLRRSAGVFEVGARTAAANAKTDTKA